MEHLHADPYHSFPLEFAQDSCRSDVCQHKGHSLQPLSNINIVKVLSWLKDQNRDTNRNVLTLARELSPTVNRQFTESFFYIFLSVSLSYNTGHWLRKEMENSFAEHFGEVKCYVILPALLPPRKRQLICIHLHAKAAFCLAFYPYVKMFSENLRWGRTTQTTTYTNTQYMLPKSTTALHWTYMQTIKKPQHS